MLLLFLCVNILRPNLFYSRCLATVGDGGKELVGLPCTGSTQQCLSVCPAPLGVLFLAVSAPRLLVLCMSKISFPGLFLKPDCRELCWLLELLRGFGHHLLLPFALGVQDLTHGCCEGTGLPFARAEVILR